MMSIAAAMRRLGLAATAIVLIAGHAGAAPDSFGIAKGQSAAGLPDAMWAEDFGYLGARTCDGDLAAQTGCVRGQDVLVFQPVALGRAGRVYVTVESGRVAAVAADLHYVAFSDG